MFDVSFSELLVIAVVALLVIGPERLPKVARTIGALTGRVQRYVVQVKEEVNRELRFEELNKLQQEIKQSVESAQSNIQQQAATIEKSIIEQNVVLKADHISNNKPIRQSRVSKAKVSLQESKDIATDKKLTQKTVKKVATKVKKAEM